MSGWSNYSGMVIVYKIYESIMDNRVSKSELFILNNFVKEQRVYGNCHFLKDWKMIKMYSNGLWEKVSCQNPF